MQHKFGDGFRNGLGNLDMRLSKPNGRHIPIFADVVQADIQLLLGLDFLRQEVLLLNYLENRLESWAFRWNMPLTDKFGHIFVR